MKLIKVFQGLAGMLLLGTFLLVYWGFYNPDPYTLGRWPGICTFILWGFRLGMPVLAAGIVFLVVGVKKKRKIKTTTSKKNNGEHKRNKGPLEIREF